MRTRTELIPELGNDILPPRVNDYVQSVAESLQVCPDMVANIAIGVVSLASQQRFKVSIKADWSEPVNVYIAVIAPPSERKSPVIKQLTAPVYEYDQERNKELLPDIKRSETMKSLLEEEIRTLKKSYFNKKSDRGLVMGELDDAQRRLIEFKEVTPIRTIADDITMEALVGLMESNNEKMAIVSSEGGIFDMMAGRYSQVPSFDPVLKAFSGDPFSSDRKTSAPVSLYNPSLTMCLMVQPAVIKSIMQNDNFRGKGLLARFLFVVPNSKVGARKYETEKIDEFMKYAYDDLIKSLLDLEVLEGPRTNRTKPRG